MSVSGVHVGTPNLPPQINAPILTVFLLSPELPSMARAGSASDQVSRERRKPGTRGRRRASRAVDEGGRPTGSGEGSGRRGVSGEVSRGAEKRVQEGDPEGTMKEGTAGRGVLGGGTRGAEKRAIEGDPEGAMVASTARRSPERKEAAFRHWLQMTAFTRAVAGELEGAWAREWLRVIAVRARAMLSQDGDQVGRVVREVGGTLRTTRMDGDRIHVKFGLRQKIESTGTLKKIAWVGYRPKSGREATCGVGWRTGTTGAPLSIGEKCLRKWQQTWPWARLSCFQ